MLKKSHAFDVASGTWLDLPDIPIPSDPLPGIGLTHMGNAIWTRGRKIILAGDGSSHAFLCFLFSFSFLFIHTVDTGITSILTPLKKAVLVIHGQNQSMCLLIYNNARIIRP